MKCPFKIGDQVFHHVNKKDRTKTTWHVVGVVGRVIQIIQGCKVGGCEIEHKRPRTVVIVRINHVGDGTRWNRSWCSDFMFYPGELSFSPLEELAKL